MSSPALEKPAVALAGPAAALVSLCRRSPGETDPEAAWPGFTTRAFQESLHRAATRHEVLGLVLGGLLRAPGLDSGLQAGYRDALQLLRRRAALWDLERDYILTRLHQAGLPVLLLKGAALRLSVYRDPVERQFGDLDLLLAPDKLDDAVAVLEHSGYRREPESNTRLYIQHHHHLRLFKDTGFLVELHWALEPPDTPFALDPAAFHAGAVAIGATRIPCAEHMLLHLASQNVEDGFSLLRRIVDLDRLIAASPPLDWNRVAAEALRMRVTVPLAVSLRLAQLLLGADLPPGFIPRLGLSPATRAHQALLDPVGLLLEQRTLTRAALARLVVLWSIPEPATRKRVFADMHAERYGQLGRKIRQEDPLPWWSGWSQSAKLLAYQGWLYLAHTLTGTSARRARKFWHGA